MFLDMIALTCFLVSSKMSTGPGLTDLCNLDSLRRSAECPEKSSEKKHTWELNNSDDDMCQTDKDDFIMQEAKLGSSLMPENFKVIAFFFFLVLGFCMST